VDNIIYSIFLFITLPMVLMIGFTEKRQKATIAFMTIGIAVCLVASELNTLLISLSGFKYFYYTVTFSPLVEELLKSVPLILTVFFYVENPVREKVITWGFAIGVGFAIFENIVVFFQNGSEADLLWSLFRGIGSGLVHGLCTGFVGMGLCIIRDFRKPYIFGIFSLLSLAAIYHGTYNCMVQSDELKYFGFCLPLVTYILLYFLYRKYRKIKEAPEK